MASASLTDRLQEAGGVVGPWRHGEAVLHFGDATAEYRALIEGVGLVDLSGRTQIELTGEDRASFLHNLSTNEIRKLAVGRGCEAFLCNAQGHTLAHAFVFCLPDSLVLDTVPSQGERLLAHLDRYLIREKVELHDRSGEWGELLLAGPEAQRVLQALGIQTIPSERLSGGEVELDGRTVSLWRVVDFIGPAGVLLTCRQDDLAPLWERLRDAGARPCGQQAAEAARIEAGFPEYGVDINDRNLPQEVARDSLAISFVKGCYIGQETVARIDALGHVNKTLVGVRFAGSDLPPRDTRLSADGNEVGKVTSAAFSPRLDAPLALAYVRRGHNAPGTRLDSPLGEAEVVALPLS